MRKETILVVVLTAVLLVGLLYGAGPMLAATPTPVKVSELTPVTTVTPDSLLYIVEDPASTPLSRQASVEAAVHAGVEPIGISGLEITISGNTTITGTLEVDGATQLDGTLTLESVAFSGPVTFGSEAGCVEDTTIAHGLGITPTSVLLTPYSAVTTTVYVKATDATSITIGLVDTDAIADVYWLAGK